MNTAESLSNGISLLQLIDGLCQMPEQLRPGLKIGVNGLSIDSRELRAGNLFLACFGRNHDARDYIADALEAGASAVLAESGGAWQGIRMQQGVPIVAIDNLAGRCSEIASRFYQCPSESLTVIGITGTNGKTSCCQFIAQLFSTFGLRCGVMGTLGYGIPGDYQETELTTPDAVFTQMALSRMQQQNIEPVAMEVSSVGMHQNRVAAVRFDTAVFTNLTRDHLDYHESMEAYAESKRKLFTMPDLKSAVINLDDPRALSIINAIGSGVEVLTYSTHNPLATVHAEDYELSRDGFTARINSPIGSGNIQGQLLGCFNLSNMLAAAACALTYLPGHQQFSIDELCANLSTLKPVTGRMEIVAAEGGLTTVVDYAHTPDGLRSALAALRDHFEGKIWCVFGCGGNRDKGKRSLMGEIAEQMADRLILTDDNPRHEQGDEIISHILSGIKKPTAVYTERNRAQAINMAVNQAQVGDVVLIAGKGHETYQETDGTRHLFSDTSHVRLAMKARNN